MKAEPHKKKRHYGIYLLIVIVIIIAAYFLMFGSSSKYDAFAKCLTANGIKFYGAFWCPHCKDQKSMFGNSIKYAPYIECSTPDGQGQLQLCQNVNITGYPTWIFANGTREEGELSLQELSDKTGCNLP